MELIDKLIEKYAERNVRLYSVTQIKDNKADIRYITPSSACHNSYSVAKAFTVTAIGMLVDAGLLSVYDKIYDILGEYFPATYDKKWEDVTVDNVLLHKMGIEHGFLDIDTEDITEYGTDDFLKVCFSASLPIPIGEKRVYSDAAYYILSRVVARISGENLCDFLRTRLFNPLKFQEVAWSICPQGYSMGATGLYIRTCDMAKLGVVYLNDGIYKDATNGYEARIVSKAWTDFALEHGYELKLRGVEGNMSYSKGGMYGQMLYLSKTDNTVLAWHAFDKTGAAKEIMAELGI